MVHEHPSCAELFVREHNPTTAFEILYEGIIKRGAGAMWGLCSGSGRTRIRSRLS